MPAGNADTTQALRGHALRNHNLRKRSLKRSESAPPLARKAVEVRVVDLNMTRIELARKSGISRGALRDLELGVHTPTRNTLERFIEFCEENHVAKSRIEELIGLYAGAADSLGHMIQRLELRAGSSPKLAKQVGISAATLWEYRRGNFPVPHSILLKLCDAVGEEFEPAEKLWEEAERQRFMKRGFPESIAVLCVLRLRAGHAESDLLNLGLGTAQLRRLCYLELIPWTQIVSVVKTLVRNDAEFKEVRDLWQHDFQEQKKLALHAFGSRVRKMRLALGVTRRETSDLFLIGGKKPARIIKHIEEDGHYSQQAFPAGIVALVTSPEYQPESVSDDDLDDHEVDESSESPVAVNGKSRPETAKPFKLLDSDEARELRKMWEYRRLRFHLRHRPEMQLDMRIQREYFGYDVAQAAEILGYTNLEYQKIERGIEKISDSARERILEAVEVAGLEKVKTIFERRARRDEGRVAWKSPVNVTEMLKLLAKREGGVVPLSRKLRDAGLYGISPPRLRSYIIEEETPTWHLLHKIAETCEVKKLQAVHINWIHRFRAQLQTKSDSLLSVEIRLLIAEVEPTLRAFSQRLPFNYSVLLRDLYRIESKFKVKWEHIERILRAAELPSSSERWRVIHRLWLAQT